QSFCDAGASKMWNYRMMYLFILDSLGTTELLVILGAALIFFGPRKLPQLSRQLGKSLSEFRRASDDFKRTWEREVNLESFDKGIEPDAGNSIFDKATEKIRAAREAAALDSAGVSGTADTNAPAVPLNSLHQNDKVRFVFPELTKLGPSDIPAGASVMARVDKDSQGSLGLFTDERLAAGNDIIPKDVKLPIDLNKAYEKLPDQNNK